MKSASMALEVTWLLEFTGLNMNEVDGCCQVKFRVQVLQETLQAMGPEYEIFTLVMLARNFKAMKTSEYYKSKDGNNFSC